jgi:hypothetical protein
MTYTHTLFHPEVFQDNEEFKQARCCQIAMDKSEPVKPEAKKNYTAVLVRLMAADNLSRDDAADKLATYIREESRKREMECAQTLGANAARLINPETSFSAIAAKQAKTS